MLKAIPYPSRLTLFVMRWTRPCYVICWFLIINAALWLLTYQRLSNPKLFSRMLLEAKIISLHKDGTHPTTADVQDIINRSGLRFYDTNEMSANDASDAFCRDAVALSGLDTGSPDFIPTLRDLGRLANNALSDQPPIREPTFAQKLMRDYFEFGGVSFRIPEDIDKARANAARLINYQGIFDSQPNDVSVWDRLVDWHLIALYDYKRVELNNFIPCAFCLLALCTGFLLRTLYADYVLPKRQCRWSWSKSMACELRSRIRRKDRTWLPIWQFSVSNNELKINGGGGLLFDCLLIATGVFTVFYELYSDDPEIRTEWILNCLIFPSAVILVVLLLWIAIRLASHKLNALLSNRSPEFWQRVFRPIHFAIAGAIGTTLWALIWSVFVLRASAANHRIIVRGTGQGIASGVILVLLLLLFAKFAANFNKLSDEQRVQLKDEDRYNTQKDGFCEVFLKKTDERFIAAMLFVLLPGFSLLLKLFP